jgi:hypothetical protein
VLGSCLVAAEPSTSAPLLGYGKTTWAMSPDAVMSAESSRAFRLEKPERYKGAVGLIRIPHLEIASQDFHAEFLFDEKGERLVQVLVKSYEEKNPRVNVGVFRSLEKILTEKYGAPSYKSDLAPYKVGDHVISWCLGETVIELHYLHISDSFAMVSVSYIPVAASTVRSQDL